MTWLDATFHIEPRASVCGHLRHFGLSPEAFLSAVEYLKHRGHDHDGDTDRDEHLDERESLIRPGPFERW